MKLFKNNVTKLKRSVIFIPNIYLTFWKIEDGNQTDIEHYWVLDWIWHYFRIMEQSLI